MKFTIGERYCEESVDDFNSKWIRFLYRVFYGVKYCRLDTVENMVFHGKRYEKGYLLRCEGPRSYYERCLNGKLGQITPVYEGWD